MAEPKRYRSRRDTQPPTPFTVVFEVEEYEKVNVGTDEEPTWTEKYTGNWVEEEKSFHHRHRVPSELVLDIQGADPADPASGPRQSRAVRRLIELTVVEPEFLELMGSERYMIDGEVLNGIINDIIEAAANRPTSPSGN